MDPTDRVTATSISTVEVDLTSIAPCDAAGWTVYQAAMIDEAPQPQAGSR